MNSRPRWLISITDMPASCQLTSSHFAFSSTSTGMVAGPAPKLKMRAVGLVGEAAAMGVVRARRRIVRLRARAAVAARMAVAVRVAVAVLAVLLVAVHDPLDPGELLALGEVDERDTLRGAAHLADLVHARADEHASRGDEHDLVVRRGEGRGDDLAVPLARLDRDHALRAAAVARVFHDGRPLPEAVLGRGEDALALVLGDEERDHAAALRKVHAAHAARAAAHG